MLAPFACAYVGFRLCGGIVENRGKIAGSASDWNSSFGPAIDLAVGGAAVLVNAAGSLFGMVIGFFLGVIADLIVLLVYKPFRKKHGLDAFSMS